MKRLAIPALVVGFLTAAFAAETTYTKSKAIDFGGSFCSDTWLDEIAAVTTMPTPVRVDTAGDAIDTVFADALTQDEADYLDVLDGAHNGLRITSTFLVAEKLFSGSIAIVATDTWAVLDGVATDPLSPLFGLAPAEAVARVSFVARTDGTGAEIRLEESFDNRDQPVVLNSAFQIPDTGNVWKSFSFTTDTAPRPVPNAKVSNEYCLMARLDGATSAEVKMCSLMLLKVKVE
jgi:hypothetical protein